MLVTPVTTSEHHEAIRLLRNAGASAMAHDAHEVTPEENARYWAMRGHELRAWLYHDEGRLVGCSSLHTRQDGRTWTFLAVAADSCGQGYGRRIFTHLLEQHAGELWACVRADNAPSARLHRPQDGWTVEGIYDGVITYRREPRQ